MTVDHKPVSEHDEKPVFDESALAQLLEAAYVIQEHNRRSTPSQSESSKIHPHDSPQAASSAEPALENPLTESSLTEGNPAGSVPVLASTDLEEVSATDDYTLTLAQIVETQRQIQVRHLPSGEAMALIIERATSIAHAAGGAIGIVADGQVLYRAAQGKTALPVGSEVPIAKALCSACLRTGQVIRCADVNPEFLLDAEECHRRGIASLIAVPIYHDGGIAGGLELYFARADAFSEPDVHTCQLMAGLVTESLAREQEVSGKPSATPERSVMLEASRKLKASLAAGALSHSAKAARATGPKSTNLKSAPAAAEIYICRKCGHALVAEEQFCGKCGSPRRLRSQAMPAPTKQALRKMRQARKKSARSERERRAGELNAADSPGDTVATPAVTEAVEEQPSSQLAGTGANQAFARSPAVSTLSRKILDTEPGKKKEKEKERQKEPSHKRSEDSLLEKNSSFPDFDPEDRAAALDSPLLTAHSADISGNSALSTDEHPAEKAKENLALALNEAHATPAPATPSDATWSSAANARDFLEQAATLKNRSALANFWQARRGDVYLAVAVLLVAGVVRWGIWSNHAMNLSGGNASHRKSSPDADLPLYDRLLIGLGLAEAPETPEDKGNPDTQVWVDLHTALYYCPGADLYGKTPKGKFTTQKDAQMDQFESASRRACP